jgi:ABC-type proline/glycine betaine transport system permease subunit
MERWIRDLINAATSGIVAAVSAVADRIAWVYTVFITLGIKVRTAFDGALNGIRTKLTALLSVTREVYVTLHWLVFIRIPQVIAYAVNTATHYLTEFVVATRDALRHAINNLLLWAVQQVQRIDNFISQIIHWATTTFNDLIAKVVWLLVTVTTLLTDPRRLATWLIDALAVETLRWLDRNADRFVQILRDRSVGFTMQLARRIEDIIVRLL